MKNENQNWRPFVLRLKEIAKDKGISHQRIADETGMQRPNVSRFFAAKGSAPHFDTFLKIASAIGVKIEIKNKK